MLNHLETDDLYEDEGFWKLEEEVENHSSSASLAPQAPMMIESKVKDSV